MEFSTLAGLVGLRESFVEEPSSVALDSERGTASSYRRSQAPGANATLTRAMPPQGIPDPPCLDLDGEYVLNGWRPEDADAHRSFALDSEAARFFGWTVQEARAAPDSHYEEAIRRFQAEWQDGTRYSVAIRRLSNDEAVGSVELRPTGDAANVSYMVAAELRGQGLASRALRAMLTWGALELNLRQATLVCHVDNRASRRVAEKCDFVFVSRQGDELFFRRAVP